MDRIDPNGGWFNLGDRVLNPELPEGRILQPRSAESIAMQPRQSGDVTIYVPGIALQPDANTTLFTKANVWLEPGVGASKAFFAALPPLPDGTEIYELAMRSYRATAVGTVILASSVCRSDINTPTSGSCFAFVASTSVAIANYVTDSIAPLAYGSTKEEATIQNATYQYSVLVGSTINAPSVAGDGRVVWVRIKARIPQAS